MKRRLTTCIAAALASSLIAGAADAAVITVTYGGKVVSVDPPVEGLGGQPVVGADFTATFRLDEAMGASSFSATGSQHQTVFPVTTDLTGVSVAFGGTTFDFRCDEIVTSFCWVGHFVQDGPASQVYSSFESFGPDIRRSGWRWSMISSPSTCTAARTSCLRPISARRSPMPAARPSARVRSASARTRPPMCAASARCCSIP